MQTSSLARGVTSVRLLDESALTPGVKIINAFPTGLAASSLCINRRLAAIAASKSVTMGHRERRFSMYIDLVIGVGIPVLIMILSYVFQPHRFNIVEGLGCEPVIWDCIGAILTIVLAPVALSMISAVYGCTLLPALAN